MSEPERLLGGILSRDPRAIGRAITLVEDGSPQAGPLLEALGRREVRATIVGITGPGGAGKSTLVQHLIGQYRGAGRRVGVVAIDPSSPLSGGALLGDRIRMMRHALDPDVVVRSMATRGRIGGLCAAAGAAARILAASGCDPVILETVGVGQAEIDVVRLADLTALVLAPGLGDDIQAMKAGLAELADLVVVNKSDHPGAQALALDMEAVLREKGRRVLLTCAAEGTGVAELAAALDEGAALLRQTGEANERRRRCRDAEILDWAVELLRPALREALGGRSGGPADPRAAAAELVAALCPPSPKHAANPPEASR